MSQHIVEPVFSDKKKHEGNTIDQVDQSEAFNLNTSSSQDISSASSVMNNLLKYKTTVIPKYQTPNDRKPLIEQPKEKKNQQQQKQPKKGKVDKPRQLANKDSFLRLSYLHQSTHQLINNTQSSSSQDVDMTPLQQIYGRQIQLTSLRSQTKLDPHLKRQYCKSCHSLLIPGVNMRIRLENEGSEKGELLTWYCLKDGCNGVRRFPVGRGKLKKAKERSMKGDLSMINSEEHQGLLDDEDFVLFTDRKEHVTETI